MAEKFFKYNQKRENLTLPNEGGHHDGKGFASV
jgi:hypothetical protein